MATYRDRSQDDEPRHGAPQADGLDNRWSLDKPADQHHRRGENGGGGPNGPEDPASRNTAILRSTALMMALCMAFALPQPDALMAPLFSTYLFAAAGAGLLWGLITRPPIRAPHLTHWDQAAFLVAASLFAGFFTDPEAARQAVEAAKSGGG